MSGEDTVEEPLTSKTARFCRRRHALAVQRAKPIYLHLVREQQVLAALPPQRRPSATSAPRPAPWLAALAALFYRFDNPWKTLRGYSFRFILGSGDRVLECPAGRTARLPRHHQVIVVSW